MVRRLGRSEPALGVPGLRLDDGQSGIARLGDELPAALGDSAPDKPADPSVAVAPGQFHELIPRRVHIDRDREQPRPRDPDAAETVVLNQMDAVRGDDIRLGDHVTSRQRALSSCVTRLSPRSPGIPTPRSAASSFVGRVRCGPVRLARLIRRARTRVMQFPNADGDGAAPYVSSKTAARSPRMSSRRRRAASGLPLGLAYSKTATAVVAAITACNRAARRRSRTRTAPRRSRPGASPLTSWAPASRLPPAGQSRRTSGPARSPDATLRRTSRARMARSPCGCSRIISPARPASRVAPATW